MFYNTLIAEYEHEEKMRQIRAQHERELFPLPTNGSKTNWVVLALNQIRLFLF